MTGSVAREICEREHIKAMMSGSIASLGSEYVIALDATNCAHRRFARPRAGDGVEQGSRSLGSRKSLRPSLRGKLGESLASIQKYDTSVTEATTSSLEALKGLRGRRRNAQRGRARPSPFLYSSTRYRTLSEFCHGLCSALGHLLQSWRRGSIGGCAASQGF